ncbi:hypothetical protein AGOR_G00117040 [Albula goreensis]|uniref:N-acylneuraminate-9-phosphatase n=1 Tax=Albula goreensis TaxID=1534307 RepID=A0A8T3DEF9_9TELE|nr:hypothetical protein AGOR_G00117040 [Albula goreensis]
MEGDGIKAILFDLDNTLIDTAGANRESIKKVDALLGTRFSQDEVHKICEVFKLKLLHEKYDPSGNVTIDDIRVKHWEEAMQETGTAEPHHDLAVECYYLWKNTRLQLLTIPGPVQAMLENLRGKHKLLLLTNGVAQTQREKIQAVHCEGLFHAVVVGGEHPEEKPALSIFRHCFGLLGVGPQDCVMVGDSLDTDILGGVSAGVRATVWINSNGRDLPPGASVRPDYTIESILELPIILSTLQ